MTFLPLVYGGLILGIVQSIRLLLLDLDLSAIHEFLKRSEIRPGCHTLTGRIRTRKMRAIHQHLGAIQCSEDTPDKLGTTLPTSNSMPSFSASLGHEEVMQLMLHDLIERFSADSVAVLTCDVRSQYQVLQIHRNGMKGDRFREILIARFQSYFQRGEVGGFGRTDHILEKRIAGDLSYFGFSQSLSGQCTTSRKLVIWIGFVTAVRDSSSLYKEFCGFLEKIQIQMQEYETNRGVQEQYLFEKQRSEERARLLAYAAHDMRSPINSLRMTLFLLDQDMLSAEQRLLVGNMRASCELLSEIVDDARDFSQYRAGHLTAEKSEFFCVDLVERVSRSFDPLAREKKVTLIRSVSGALQLNADQRQLGRVLANIVGNAVKFTEQGFVSVSAKATEQGRVIITVRDSGPGMNADQLQHIFEPYTRFAENSVEGLGLGLSLSRIFSQLNNCQIEVASTPGEGSVVMLSTPGRSALPEASPAPKSSRRWRILVADDHQDVAGSFARVLGAQGFEIQIATSIVEAHAVISFFQPDFLITDLTFEDGDGEDLVRHARQMRRPCLVCILSGRELKVEHRKLLQDPGIFYQQKPANLELILAWMHKTGAVLPALSVCPDDYIEPLVAG